MHAKATPSRIWVDTERVRHFDCALSAICDADKVPEKSCVDVLYIRADAARSVPVIYSGAYPAKLIAAFPTRHEAETAASAIRAIAPHAAEFIKVREGADILEFEPFSLLTQ